MLRTIEGIDMDDGARRNVLAYLDEYCRGMTLQDVHEWYADAFLNEATGSALNLP